MELFLLGSISIYVAICCPACPKKQPPAAVKIIPYLCVKIELEFSHDYILYIKFCQALLNSKYHGHGKEFKIHKRNSFEAIYNDGNLVVHIFDPV